MPVVGVGTDLVDLQRFARLLDSGGRRFLDRWFRTAEVDHLLGQPEPARRAGEQFAAKEAVLKALRVPDTGPVRWREIEISHGPGGGLRVILHGSIQELAESARVDCFHIALSTTGQVATATVLAVSGSAVNRPRSAAE